MYRYILADCKVPTTNKRKTLLAITSSERVKYTHRDLLLEIYKIAEKDTNNVKLRSLGFIYRDPETSEFFAVDDSEIFGEKTNEKDKQAVKNFLKREIPGLCYYKIKVYEDTIVD